MRNPHLLRVIAVISLLCVSFVHCRQSHAQTTGTLIEPTRLPTLRHPGTRDIELAGAQDKAAILICVSQFVHPGITELPGASGDCDRLKEALEGGDFTEDRVIVLNSQAAVENRRPTVENIIATIKRINLSMRPGGLLFVHIVSHGFVLGGRVFVVAEDTIHDLTNPMLLAATSVAMENLEVVLQHSGQATEVIVSLDICRSGIAVSRSLASSPMGAEVEGLFMKRATERGLNRKHFVVFHATSHKMFAYENFDGRVSYGLYSKALATGLGGAGAEPTGKVTVSSIARYVRDEVIREVKLILGDPPRQVPQLRLSGPEAGAIVLSGTDQPLYLPPLLSQEISIPKDKFGVAEPPQLNQLPRPTVIRGVLVGRLGRQKPVEVTLFASGLELLELNNNAVTWIDRREIGPTLELEIAGRRLILPPTADLLRSLLR